MNILLFSPIIFLLCVYIIRLFWLLCCCPCSSVFSFFSPPPRVRTWKENLGKNKPLIWFASGGSWKRPFKHPWFFLWIPFAHKTCLFDYFESVLRESGIHCCFLFVVICCFRVWKRFFYVFLCLDFLDWLIFFITLFVFYIFVLLFVWNLGGSGLFFLNFRHLGIVFFHCSVLISFCSTSFLLFVFPCGFLGRLFVGTLLGVVWARAREGPICFLPFLMIGVFGSKHTLPSKANVFLFFVAAIENDHWPSFSIRVPDNATEIDVSEAHVRQTQVIQPYLRFHLFDILLRNANILVVVLGGPRMNPRKPRKHYKKWFCEFRGQPDKGQNGRGLLRSRMACVVVFENGVPMLRNISTPFLNELGPKKGYQRRVETSGLVKMVPSRGKRVAFFNKKTPQNWTQQHIRCYVYIYIYICRALFGPDFAMLTFLPGTGGALLRGLLLGFFLFLFGNMGLASRWTVCFSGFFAFSASL